jgi:hypothetical protein
MKARERNIDQIKFDYKKQCIALNRFYLEKTGLISINKINIKFIFRKQT